MHKTKIAPCDSPIMVDINGLKSLLSVGNQTARDIAEKAGAVYKIGHRKLYIVAKIKAFIESQ